MDNIIKRVFPYNFRNLHNTVIECSGGINLFIGDNAQGKTNVLELLYYAIHGKSFKYAKTTDIITNGQHSLATQIILNENQVTIQKTLSTRKITLNNAPTSAIQTSELVPMQIIAADKGYVVGGDYSLKRSIINWGVFHVEPEFKSLFIAYKKIQKNINVLIKDNNKDQLLVWFKSLATHMYNINSFREKYLQQLGKLQPLSYFQNNKTKPQLLHYSFSTGLPHSAGNSIEEIQCFLQKNIDFILKNKYLRYGPHAATLEFNYNGISEHNLSRGQQKTLSLLFYLHQLHTLLKLGKHPVVLIDDISAELDTSTIKSLLDFLQQKQMQSFITNIHPLEGITTTNFVKSGKVEYNRENVF